MGKNNQFLMRQSETNRRTGEAARAGLKRGEHEAHTHTHIHTHTQHTHNIQTTQTTHTPYKRRLERIHLVETKNKIVIVVIWRWVKRMLNRRTVERARWRAGHVGWTSDEWLYEV